MNIGEIFAKLWNESGFAQLTAGFRHQFVADDPQHLPEFIHVFGRKPFLYPAAHEVDVIEYDTVFFPVTVSWFYVDLSLIQGISRALYIASLLELVKAVSCIRRRQLGIS